MPDPEPQYSSAPVGKVTEPCPLKAGWIEIEFVGEDNSPVPDVRVSIITPDGGQRSGKTDARGLARVEGFPKGTCTVSFPDLDTDAWAFIESV